MNPHIATGFKSVHHHIQFNPGGLEKGSLLVVFHVRNLNEIKTDEYTIIQANVVPQTNVTATPYDVNLEVSTYNRNIYCRKK